MPTDEENAFPKPTVLVVDDQEGSRDIIHDLLRDDGFPVLTAKDGAEAVCILSRPENDIGIVLLDLGMPGMNGLEVCRMLREQENAKEIHVLFVSGYYTEETAAEARRLGAYDFLAKPVRASELRLKVNAAARVNPNVPEDERSRAYVLALAEEAERERRDDEGRSPLFSPFFSSDA